MMFTIKNLKTLSSGAYTASLYKDGTKVATVEDDGRGGPPRLHPTDTAHYGQARTQLEAELTEYATTITDPTWATPAGELTGWAWETAVGYLIQQAENAAFGRKCARKGVVALVDPSGFELVGVHPTVVEEYVNKGYTPL